MKLIRKHRVLAYVIIVGGWCLLSLPPFLKTLAEAQEHGSGFSRMVLIVAPIFIAFLIGGGLYLVLAHKEKNGE